MTSRVVRQVPVVELKAGDEVMILGVPWVVESVELRKNNVSPVFSIDQEPCCSQACLDAFVSWRPQAFMPGEIAVPQPPQLRDRTDQGERI